MEIKPDFNLRDATRIPHSPEVVVPPLIIPSQEILVSPKQVFLCYCHKDLSYAERLLTHFASCQKTSGLAVWDDSQILPGSLWHNELACALATAHFAVLLISADFLASPFLTTQGLPQILHAAYAQTTSIFPVLLTPCLFEESSLSPFQTFNSSSKPLSSLSPSQRDALWVRLVRTIIQTPLPRP